MKAEWRGPERDAEVRKAARAWREAGAIDGAVLAEIEKLYPAVWRRPGPLWGILVFFFTSLFAATLLISSAVAHILAMTAFLMAAGLAFAADRLQGSTSSVGAAAAASGAFWAVACLLIATGEAAKWQGRGTANVILLVGAVGWAAVALRWGYPALTTLAAVFFYLLVARAPAGRALWLLLGTALAILTSRFLDRRTLPASHRRSAAAAMVVSLAAVYASVNLYALDHRWIEVISDANRASEGTPAAVVRLLAAIATSIFPVFALGWGIRSRRTLVIDVGIVAAALSLATLRFYVHIAPLWAILSAAGGAVIVAALGVHRWLARAAQRERGGFTAEPLFEDERRQHTLGVLGAIPLSPQASASLPEQGRFSGGGGSYGGGGSTGTF